MNYFKSVAGVGMLGVIGNLFLSFIKLVSGVLFSSQAMIADAVNSLMDIFASFMTLMGGRISSKPRDQDHQFGHGKAEFVFSLFVSMSMIAGGLFIFLSSLKSMIVGKGVEFSYLLFGTCLVTILVKFFLYCSTREVFLDTKSLLVYSNMIDHRNDMIITSFTLLSVIFSYFSISLFDSIVGMGISIVICFSGLKIFLESYRVLMDCALSSEDARKMQDFILKQKGVEGITKFETAPAGQQYMLILSILVDGNLTTFESHHIADELEKHILNTFPSILLVTIHVNPYKPKKKKA